MSRTSYNRIDTSIHNLVVRLVLVVVVLVFGHVAR